MIDNANGADNQNSTMQMSARLVLDLDLVPYAVANFLNCTVCLLVCFPVHRAIA